MPLPAEFTYHKPKPVPSGVDPHLQKLFLRKYRRIRKTMDKTNVMLFADAVHLTQILLQHTVASYGWIKNGQEKQIATNSSKMRMNINGMINIDRYQMSADFTDNVNSDSTIRLLEKVEKMYLLAGPNLNLIERV